MYHKAFIPFKLAGLVSGVQHLSFDEAEFHHTLVQTTIPLVGFGLILDDYASFPNTKFASSSALRLEQFYLGRVVARYLAVAWRLSSHFVNALD